MLWNTVPSLNRCFQMMVGLFQIILLPCLLTISQIFCVFLLTTVESQLLVGFVGKARKTVVTTVVTWVWSSFPAFQWLKWRFMSFWRSLTCWGPHQSSKVKYSWIHVKKWNIHHWAQWISFFTQPCEIEMSKPKLWMPGVDFTYKTGWFRWDFM